MVRLAGRARGEAGVALRRCETGRVDQAGPARSSVRLDSLASPHVTFFVAFEGENGELRGPSAAVLEFRLQRGVAVRARGQLD